MRVSILFHLICFRSSIFLLAGADSPSGPESVAISFWVLYGRLSAMPAPLGRERLRALVSDFWIRHGGARYLHRLRGVTRAGPQRHFFPGRTAELSGTPAFFVHRQAIKNPAELAETVERILGGEK